MQAKWQNEIIAQSDQTETVDGYIYFPRAAVRMDLLQVTAKTAHDQQCPHGVQFFDLVHGDRRSERAAWSYEAPQAAMRSVDHWIGFWKDVDVS